MTLLDICNLILIVARQQALRLSFNVHLKYFFADFNLKNAGLVRTINVSHGLGLLRNWLMSAQGQGPTATDGNIV